MAPQRPSRFVLLAFAVSVWAACSHVHEEGRLGWTPKQLMDERHCQEGAMSSCANLGRFLLGRTGIEADRNRGIVLLEVACGGGEWGACVELGAVYSPADGQSRARARARDVLTQACQHNYAVACTRLGDLSHDATESSQHYSQGCRLGDAEGCEAIGHAKLKGRPVSAENEREARVAFEAACGLGSKEGCFQAALLSLKDPDRRQDGARFLFRNCEQGHSDSCVVVALWSAPLISDEPDCPRVRKLAEAACSDDSEEGCVLIDACKIAAGSEEEATEASTRLLPACETSRSPLACLYWADGQPRLRHTYVVSEREDDEDRRAYGVACRSQTIASEVACPRIAKAEWARAQTSGEKEWWMSVLQKACDQKSGAACSDLADVYENGRGKAVDHAKVRDLRLRASQLGAIPCCSSPGTGQKPGQQQ